LPFTDEIIYNIKEWVKQNIISKTFKNKDLDLDITVTKNSIDKLLHYLYSSKIAYIHKLLIVYIIEHIQYIIENAYYINKDEIPRRKNQQINITSVKSLVIHIKIEKIDVLARVTFWDMKGSDNLLKTITFTDVFLERDDYNPIGQI